jgi:predicted nucleotidyltransferase
MRPALEDYWRVLDSFVDTMSGLGEDLVSILLWGSLARGEAVAGKSDVLDLVIVVRRGLLEEREGFQRVVERIVAACEPVERSGLPYSHPPFLYAEEELGNLEDLYRLTLVSPQSSRVLFGDDVRPAVPCVAEARLVASCAFFAMQRRFVHPFTIFLHAATLSDREQAALATLLGQIRSNLPVLACAALGRPSNQADALADLRQALPEFDFSVFDEVAALRRGERPPGGPEDLQDLLRRTFEVAEALGELIQASGPAPWSGLLAESG